MMHLSSAKATIATRRLIDLQDRWTTRKTAITVVHTCIYASQIAVRTSGSIDAFAFDTFALATNSSFVDIDEITCDDH